MSCNKMSDSGNEAAVCVSSQSPSAGTGKRRITSSEGIAEHSHMLNNRMASGR